MQVFAAFFLCLLVAAAPAADSFPSRPVRIIVPQPAGGTMDTNARALAEHLSRAWGQPIVIDNRAGANGIIAAETVAKAAPDGYTMMYTSNSLINNELVQKKPTYHVLTDLAPITNVGSLPGYLVLVNPQVPAKTMKELIELAKSSTPVRFGSGGIGNSQHLLGELINARAGTKMIHVPYRGFAPMITAMLGNEVQVAFGAPTTVIQHIKSGRARVLAITAAKRWAGMPDVPTVGETVPGFAFEAAWHGMFAPAATPPALVSRIRDDVSKAIKVPKMREFLESGGYVPVGDTPAGFRKFLEADLKHIAEFMRIAKVEPE
jgi:tripartite-type tricarboxylate transporter receptor subunit TctC